MCIFRNDCIIMSELDRHILLMIFVFECDCLFYFSVNLLHHVRKLYVILGNWDGETHANNLLIRYEISASLLLHDGGLFRVRFTSITPAVPSVGPLTMQELLLEGIYDLRSKE